VLAELAALLGHETEIDSAQEALAALAGEIPFYAGLNAAEIGGSGIRWQQREAAASFAAPAPSPTEPASADANRETGGDGLALGTYRELWAGEVTERNPALHFLAPAQRLELAPSDAERLGVAQDDEVEVRSNGSGVRARVALRERMRPGAAFLIEGTADANANTVAAGTVQITRLDPQS